MTEDLMPCPFCGGRWRISQEPHDNGYVAGMWYVFHTGKTEVIERCRAEIRGHFDTKQHAVDAINARTSA